MKIGQKTNFAINLIGCALIALAMDDLFEIVVVATGFYLCMSSMARRVECKKGGKA